ncbi:hypothetical protein EJ05DRAFT_480754 [Pseudovirgaria hyperparasitica]|uniref:Pre-mRNA polyadenylation factor Fip1 domain-containing protein n=1 Tax=Pseudovirgaria hyperparasitica TaxID=470096 RepID=A0A6A6VQV1_9PEZI|nr:uncharacterized protein EJ05DRAFT_480754 [Pseudovirgaria hyperparasitica]KAF2753038.1 hypothetical protein EJ05DRAFT_480754 [Pseudovirgaria hyperparasitica]
MEDEDDFYGTGEGGQDANAHETPADEGDDVKDEKMDEELEEGEEEESDDSDIDIITERKDNAEPAPPRNQYQSIKQDPRPSSTDVASRGGQQSTASRISTAPTPVASQKLRDGSKFPEVHTSTVNVEADPMYEPAGKPISQVDLDADMAEHTKPWRLPGSDQSDYFNYGFDEFTWASYVIRQQTMANQLVSQKAETAQFQQMFGGGMPGMPVPPAAPAAPQGGGGGPPAGMPGMPSEQEMMQMAQMMMASGQDPSSMDFGTFMQQFGGGGGGQGQGQAQGNYGNQNYQNQGSGQNAGGGGGNFGGGRGSRRGGRWN